MKIDVTRFAIAWAAAIAVLWLLCSLLVWLLPTMMTNMTGHMLHIDMTAWQWQLSVVGVLIGLVLWFFSAAVAGALIAAIYNRLGQ